MELKYFSGLLCILSWIFQVVCLFEYCDYHLLLNTTTPKMYINSPNYPNKYPSGSSCRFMVIAPIDYQINFNCRIDFDKNADKTCSTEYFYFNVQGSTLIPGSEYFCGKGTFNRISSNNIVVISYNSLSSNVGGWFSCLATIKPTPCSCGWSNPTIETSNLSNDYENDVLSPRIVGGQSVLNNEFPSMVGIFHLAYQRIFCGATIIHRRFLLSAAHCFSSNETSDPEELNALVGDNDITVNSPLTKLYNIELIISHEDYDPQQVTNDIAIIKTVDDIAFNIGVGPACLPYKFVANDLVGSKVTSVGWGTTSFGGLQSNILFKVDLDVISLVQCQVQIKNINFGQFCTFTQGKDACQFDSGGGLFYQSDGKFYVVGIVSFGFSCATTFPSVNTRVSTYLIWIQRKLPELKFCFK